MKLTEFIHDWQNKIVFITEGKHTGCTCEIVGLGHAYGQMFFYLKIMECDFIEGFSSSGVCEYSDLAGTKHILILER